MLSLLSRHEFYSSCTSSDRGGVSCRVHPESVHVLGSVLAILTFQLFRARAWATGGLGVRKH